MNPRSKKIQKTHRNKVSSEESEDKENHARAKFNKEQEEYIAERIRPLIEDGLINNKEECIQKMFELCDEYIQIHKKGRRPKVISQTTCYAFLKKNKIKPPTKQKKKNEKKKKKNDVPTLSNHSSRAQQNEINMLLKEENLYKRKLDIINTRLIELGHREPQDLPHDNQNIPKEYADVTNPSDAESKFAWAMYYNWENSKEIRSKSRSSKELQGLSNPNSSISNGLPGILEIKKAGSALSISMPGSKSKDKKQGTFSNQSSKEVKGLSDQISLTNGNSRYFFRARNSESLIFER